MGIRVTRITSKRFAIQIMEYLIIRLCPKLILKCLNNPSGLNKIIILWIKIVKWTIIIIQWTILKIWIYLTKITTIPTKIITIIWTTAYSIDRTIIIIREIR